MIFFRFLARRLAQSALVLLGVSAIVFFSLFLTGDPVALMLPPDATRAEIATFRHAMGFDAPLWLQYLRYLGHIVTGNFGTSLRFDQPVLLLVAERLPATALLAFSAMAWSTLLGFVLGIVAAVRRGSAVDLLVRLVALAGQAIPVFWLGLLLILLVSLRWRLLPTGGYGGLSHLILPALSLGAYYMSAVTRLVRTSLAETLALDYIRTARAKGLSEMRVVLRHALRNALIPVLTVQAMQFASLLGGALITEIIFAWPGVGRLAVQAIENRDFPLVQAVVLMAAMVFVGMNLLVDIAYAALNPRIALT
jgi:ABC-type dipeptide/oligopeptide/nickel transport system permease component